MGMWKFVADKLSQPTQGPKTEKASKPANKLSKPRTNSTGNLLGVASANTSRKNSSTNLNEPLPQRSSSVPARQDVGDVAKISIGRPQLVANNSSQSGTSAADTPDIIRGRQTQRDGKEKRGRLSGFFRSRSTQAVTPEKKPSYHEVFKDFAGYSPTVEEYNDLQRQVDEDRMMKRFSVGTGSGGFTRNGNPMKRSSSLTPYTQNRLSLVPEAPSPVATPGPDLEHIAETEAILTGRSNPVSRRQSMMSTTSSYRRESRANSIISDTSEHLMPPPVRRRSMMTPGVATRRQKLQKEPPARRMSAIVSDTNSYFFSNNMRRTQTLPSEREEQSYYYDNSAPPHQSPEELLQMLQPLEKPTFRRSIDNQRAHTPNDLGHIGSFKLGSLRIVNGHASPGGTPLRVETVRDIDYFHTQRASNTPQMQPFLHGLHGTAEAPAELSAHSPERAPRPTTKSSKFSFEQPRSPIYTQADPTVFSKTKPATAFELAESYRSEITDFSSPFTTSSGNRSPEFSTTKNTAEQDEMFEAEQIPELNQDGAIGNGRRKGDELFLPDLTGKSHPRSTNFDPYPVAPQANPLAKRESVGMAYGKEYEEQIVSYLTKQDKKSRH